MLNVITLFSGYDSQCLALNRLGIPYDLVAWAEIDKHACTAHDALFPQFKGRNAVVEKPYVTRTGSETPGQPSDPTDPDNPGTTPTNPDDPNAGND